MGDDNNDAQIVAQNTKVGLLRPETKMFLEICHQYLKCRNLMDAKYQEVDDYHRIAKYNITTTTTTSTLEADSKKNKQESYQQCVLPQQQSLDGTPVKSLAELYQAAEQILPTFENTLERIVSQVQEEFPADANNESSIKMTIAPLKGRNRAQEKAEDDYMDRMPGPEMTWLYDIVRGSIAFSSADQLVACLDILQKDSSIRIVKVKNRFQNPTLTGYRDINAQIQIYYYSDDNIIKFYHVCEVQIHHQAIQSLSKELKSHTYYEYFRTYFSGATEALEERLNDLKLIISGGEEGATSLDESFLTKMLQETTEEERLLRLANLFDQQLCEHDWALRVLQRLLEIRVEIYGEMKHYGIADSYNRLGDVHQKKGDLEEAMEAYEKAQAVFLGILNGHSDFSGSLSTVNTVIRSQLKLREALQAHGASLKSHQALFDDNNGKSSLKMRFKSKSKMAQTEDTVMKMMDQFQRELDNNTLFPSGVLKFIQAEDMLQKNLAVMENAMASFKSSMAAFHQVEEGGGLSGAEAFENASVAIHALDHFEKGVLETFHQALKQITKMLVEMQSRIAIIYNNQAKVLQLQGDLDGAMDKFQSSMVIKKKTLGEDNAQVAERYVYLGNILELLGSTEVALGRYEKALLIYQNSLGEDHSLVADTLVKLANVLSNQGKRDEAMEHCFKAIGIYKRTLGEEHLSVANTYMKVGDLFLSKREHDSALEMFRQALRIQKVALGEDDVRVGETYLLISHLLRGQSLDTEEANEKYEKGLEIKRKSVSQENSAQIESELSRARTLRGEGKHDEAMAAYQNALDASKEALGSEHESLAQIYNEMACILSQQGSFGRAMMLHYKALGLLKKVPGVVAHEIVNTYIMMGETLLKQNRLDKALRLYGEALDIVITRCGNEHLEVAVTYDRIAAALHSAGHKAKAEEYSAIAREVEIKWSNNVDRD